MPVATTLPQIPLPIVTIVPSTTFSGSSFHFSDVSYSMPITIERAGVLSSNDRMVITAEMSLVKARRQILAQLETLKNAAFVLQVPAIDFIDDITAKSIKLLTENRVVRQSILGGSGLAIATYLVCANNRFGYEAILHVQTFGGEVVMTESRSKNATSQILFNGELIYLNGVSLIG